jgi:hypothetical protein
MPDIVIIPQRGTSNNPSMHFTGSALANIRMEVLPSGSISFIGTSGSLFNVTDNLLGSLMSVGDVSGLPILEVFSDDRVVMGRYGKNTLYVSGTNVGLGKVPSNAVFDVSGSAAISGSATVTGSFTANGRVTFNNGGTGGNGTLTVAGDITTYRSSTVGIIYFGSGQSNYLYYDGSNYYLNNGNVNINATYSLYFNSYGGGWYMQDTSWVRTVNSKNIWVGSGLLGGDGGLTVGYGGASPTSAGAIISGCVGIGTSSPSTKLAVVGGISLSDNNNIVWGTTGGNQSSGTNTPVITAAGSAGFYFIPDGSTSGVRARLTNYGTLLVGDTVEINGSWYNNGVGIFGKNGTDKTIVGYLGSSTSGALVAAHNSALNAWAVLNINGSQLIFRSDETERMRIINNGNVGIGTTTPTAKLEVSGDVMADNVFNPFLLMGA